MAIVVLPLVARGSQARQNERLKTQLTGRNTGQVDRSASFRFTRPDVVPGNLRAEPSRFRFVDQRRSKRRLFKIPQLSGDQIPKRRLVAGRLTVTLCGIDPSSGFDHTPSGVFATPATAVSSPERVYIAIVD